MNTKNRKLDLSSVEERCPRCGKPVGIRTVQGERFIGCAAYPKCGFRHIGQIGTILVDETVTMDRLRRQAEQDGHRKRARVNAREHQEREETKQQQSLEGELQNNILQHPALNNQRFDGVDPNVNPEPPMNTDARREFDNERREQEMEKQLKLGNMPKFSTAPKPQGPY